MMGILQFYCVNNKVIMISQRQTSETINFKEKTFPKTTLHNRIAWEVRGHSTLQMLLNFCFMILYSKLRNRNHRDVSNDKN